MYLHRLSFAALGPFAGEHSIDFDGLGGSALFLIDGPTGAGKSTIIDAIVFALFGDVSGRASDRQRLRSSFAPFGTESFAEVEFTTSFGRYLVRRTPDYPRTKLRGTGTTVVPSTVLLSRSTGSDGWEPISRSKGEADAEIQRVIGLTRAQFLQTVVLPQGEFANFLSAESKDRLAVLERIFATDLYSRVEAALDDSRRSAQAEREQSERAVLTSVQHVVSRLSDDDAAQLTDVPTGDGEAAAILAALAAITADVATRLDGMEVVAAEAAGRLAAVDTRLAQVRERAIAQGRLNAAEARLAAATGGHQEARAHLDEHGTTLGAVGTGDDDPSSAIAELDRIIGSLTSVLELERHLPRDRQAVVDLRHALTVLDDELAELALERETTLPARLLALSSLLSGALETARIAAEGAAQNEGRALQGRLDGMAGELALELQPGAACPVCGSREHPSPAEQVTATVTADALDEAARSRVLAERAQHELEVEAARLEAIAVDVVAAPGDTSGVEAPSVLPDTVAEVSAGIRAFQTRVGELDTLAARARERRAAAQSELAELARTVGEREAAVAAALDGHPTIGQRVQHLTAARSALTKVLETANEERQARDVVAAALVELAALATDDRGSKDRLDDLTRDRAVVAEEAATAIGMRDATVALQRDLDGRIDAVRRALTVREAVHARTADVIALANVVRGGEGNTLAQPLSAYVVQTMFDEILGAANRRLGSMLDGRFELRATEQRTGRALTGLGLGLEVLDLSSDSVRKTATLSGGETFCASLALALGLADTVSAHAGGIDIGMLFIDEGFGSLDGDRLDEVMAELLRLRADGRTVGVISHVSEMKKSINERIDVRPLGGRLGSTLTASWTA